MPLFTHNSKIIHIPVLTKRLYEGAFSKMGHVKRKPDTRTTKQLLENIEYYANICPEVAKFKNDLKQMNPAHLGLVSDICELANQTELLNTSINIKKPASNGKSLFEFLMETLPKASKENPESLELSQSIIDNTDSTASKYALGRLSPLYKCKEAAPHIKATIPLVGAVAESTLGGGYLMDFSKENKFVEGLMSLISPTVELDKLKILPQIIKLAEKTKAMCIIDAFPFLNSKVNISKIVENMKVFETLDKNLEGKTINLTDFLTHNTNLKPL